LAQAARLHENPRPWHAQSSPEDDEVQ